MKRFEALTGFNTKQLWVYDEEGDCYIDPPASVLIQIDENFDWGDWEAKERALQEIVDQDPDWLYDQEYTYAAEDVEI